MKSKIRERPRILIVNRCIVLNSNNELLLIQRATGDKWSSGLWEVPGGKLDEGQDVTHALEREVMEEAGLIIIPKSRLNFIDSWILTEGPYKGLPYIAIYGIGTASSSKVRLSEEHVDYKWLPYEEALTLPLTEGTRKALIALESQITS